MKKITASIMLIITLLILSIKPEAQTTNYFAGINSGSGNTGTGCTGVGAGSLININKGDFNTGFGYASLVWNTTGTRNTGLGYRALDYNKTGNDNTCGGFQSLYNTAGDNILRLVLTLFIPIPQEVQIQPLGLVRFMVMILELVIQQVVIRLCLKIIQVGIIPHWATTPYIKILQVFIILPLALNLLTTIQQVSAIRQVDIIHF